MVSLWLSCFSNTGTSLSVILMLQMIAIVLVLWVLEIVFIFLSVSFSDLFTFNNFFLGYVAISVFAGGLPVFSGSHRGPCPHGGARARKGPGGEGGLVEDGVSFEGSTI